jgi:hypothetical protein
MGEITQGDRRVSGRKQHAARKEPIGKRRLIVGEELGVGPGAAGPGGEIQKTEENKVGNDQVLHAQGL